MTSEKSDFTAPPPPYSADQGYNPQGDAPHGYAPQGYPAQGYAQQPAPYPGSSPYQTQYGVQPGGYTHTQQVIVTQPGGAGVIMTQARPPDYMVASVIACLCCFWPTGICAIYYASRANSLASEGNMIEAQRMANNARNLMITSVVIGICWIVLVIVLRVVVYSTAYSSY